MSKKQTSLYLSEVDRKKAEELMELYKIESLGKLIRLLINGDYEKLKNSVQ